MTTEVETDYRDEIQLEEELIEEVLERAGLKCNIGLGEVVVEEDEAIKLRGYYSLLDGFQPWEKLFNPPRGGKVLLSLYDIDDEGKIRSINHPYWW